MSRVVLVTGVSRGLGRAMVDGFIANGHTVVGCARSDNSVQQLAQVHGSPHHFSVVDIQSDEAVKAWKDDVVSSVGVPDLVLNNAALMNENNALWDVPPDEFSRLMDVNIKGTYYVIRHFVPEMIQAGKGVVVNFSSGWGRSTSPEVGPYCATKWAIEGLTRSLAQELPQGLAAISLNPGIINTEMLQSCFGESASHYPTAEEWAVSAVPMMLGFSASDNGAIASA